MEQTNPNTSDPSDKDKMTDSEPPAASPPQSPQPDAIVQAPPSAVNAPASSRKKLIKFIVVAVVLLIAGASAYMLVGKKDNGTNNAGQVSQKKEIPLMRLGTQEDLVSSFYPDQDSVTGIGSGIIMRSVFEGLVAWGENQRFVPLLAASWTNPDDNTWVFKLKTGVKFHNGKTMTAQDVKASLEADTPISESYSLSDIISSITIVDANTIKITTKKPDALLLNRLVYMYIFDGTSTEKNSYANGTGPFTVKAGTKYDSNNIDLVSFDSYHGTKPLVKEIIGKNYSSDDELIAAAKAHKMDLGFEFPQASRQSILAANSAVKFQTIEDTGSHSLQPITLKAGSPVQKLQVRQALYDAIDPAAVIKAAGVDGEVSSQLGPKALTGYDASITRPKLDLAAAKQLLKDAGYPNGLSLSVIYGPPADPAVKEIGRQLQAIGVTLQYHIASGFPEFNDAIVNHKYDLNYSGNTSDFADISDIVSSSFTKDGIYGAYDNPKISSLVAQAAQEFGTAKRIATLQEISRELMNDVAVIPIYTQTYSVMMSTNYYAPFYIPDGIFGTYLSNLYQQ